MIAIWLSAIGVVAPAAAAADASASSAPSPALLAALEDARSDAPARHASLLARLQTRSFLETVDTPADYADAAKRGLHVGQLVDALALNAAPSAQRAFRALTTSKTFLAHDERVAPDTPDETEVTVNLGHLDPITEVTGVKQRLRNLCFDCGDQTPEENEDLETALRAFQSKHGLSVTGTIDQATRDELSKQHGS